MQQIVDAFSAASKKFGLQINIKKTEVLFQPGSNHRNEKEVLVDGTALNQVESFTYLGRTISKDGRIDAELVKIMAKASNVFGRLSTRLWNNHHVSTRVKGKIYRAIVISTLLYGAESWTLYTSQVHKLHAFMMRRLRAIMKITWKDKVTNKEILERANLPSMEDLLIRKNLRWAWECPLRDYQSKYFFPNFLRVKERLVDHGFDTRTQSNGTLSRDKSTQRRG